METPLSETVVLRGHIIDSLTLSKVLDEIHAMGGDYQSEEIKIGETRRDISHARIRVMAPDAAKLEKILHRLHLLGTEVTQPRAAQMRPAPNDGVFPDGFYATTNLSTDINLAGTWLPVQNTCMDCGILVEPERPLARCVKMNQVRRGELILTGFDGVRVHQPEPRDKEDIFAFMKSGVSPEKPKEFLIRRLAREIANIKQQKLGKVLVVCGPAVVHTGSGETLSRIIQAGYITLLFAGNALAAHDVESALYGTSLGISLSDGVPAPHGHMNHLYAINTIRAAGGLGSAVKKGILTRGIMHACINSGCETLLAGSIRDDGPLPDVITNTTEAQWAMREKLKDVQLALLMSTMLHAIAVGNLLPGRVKTVCVDISPEVVTKLTDRGSHQTVGLVMDVEAFLQKLFGYLP